jgi:CDP-diacylglycerol---glycerol-3-phosphate 3-phosphatidyltransferase
VNLPNTLTLSRIFLTPLLVVILLTRIDGKEIYGVVIFVVAAFTDYLDGYIARKRNQVTDVGKLLDPIADKLLIIVGREFAVSGIRSIAASQGYVMPANALGKLKTVCQVLTIVVLIVADTYIEPWERFGRFLLWVTVAISLVSAVNYLWIFLRVGSSSRKLTNLRKEEIEYDDQREERKKVVS